ncbi:MAG: cytochrome c maturation protein CcmE [Gammaproteobacteria bacterium]|jgi:cytochrome c-type biogenesis protein CcmE
MSPAQTKRLLWVILIVMGVSISVGLILFALSNNVNLFYTPSEVKAGTVPMGHAIRVGGMVEKGTLTRGEGLKVTFVVTDFAESVTIHYEGILPDLFKEGQGIVAQGLLEPNHHFKATQILAKHDENYMPPEVKASLKERKS